MSEPTRRDLLLTPLLTALLGSMQPVDPAEAFRNFRGRDPRPDALPRARGVAP